MNYLMTQGRARGCGGARKLLRLCETGKGRSNSSGEAKRASAQETDLYFYPTYPTSLQTPESKKQEFRKYLEKSGVIDALTKVLVGLYEEPERPPNAVDYIKRYMGAPTGVDVEAMRAELEQLKIDKNALETTVRELNDRLNAH